MFTSKPSILRYILPAAVVALTCATANYAAAQSTPPPQPLRMVVTIKPVHALALQVLDGIATPTLVVDGVSPHTYALKPSEAKQFNEADIVVRVSEQLEPFTAKVLRSVPKSVLVVTLETASGIQTLPRRQSATFDKHEHAGHNHGHKGHKHGAAKADVDGHLWLDPRNAKAIVQEIARVASAKQPVSAAQIQANAAKAIARLDVLDKELEQTLASSKSTPFVVFHDALQYFEVRYGLTAAGSITVSPDVPPSAKRLTDLRTKIKSLNASCMFSEPGYEAKVVASVIEGTNAKSGTVDPEGISVPTGADAYETLMRGLAKSMRTCLAPSS